LCCCGGNDLNLYTCQMSCTHTTRCYTHSLTIKQEDFHLRACCASCSIADSHHLADVARYCLHDIHLERCARLIRLLQPMTGTNWYSRRQQGRKHRHRRMFNASWNCLKVLLLLLSCLAKYTLMVIEAGRSAGRNVTFDLVVLCSSRSFPLQRQ
jgi:hypothetical protein